MDASSFPSKSSRSYRDYGVFGGLRRRILASIAGVVGWISFTLLYVAFWARGFSLFQSIVVVLVSLIVLTGLLIGAWVSYGFWFVGHEWD
jgi:hypothetical protein